MVENFSDGKIEQIFKDYYEDMKKIEVFEKMTDYYNQKKSSNEIEVTDDTEIEINQINKNLNRLRFNKMKFEAFLYSSDLLEDERLIIQERYKDKKTIESICIEMFITNSSYYRKKKGIFNKFKKFYNDSYILA